MSSVGARRQILRISALALAVLPATHLADSACANPVKSHYTTIDLRTCRKTKEHPDGSAWTCPGLPGYHVWLAEGDLRTFVSVGIRANKRRAAEQTLASFNSIFPKDSSRTTLEWRFRRSGSTLVPYATILRYFTSNGTVRGEVLVVAKVTKTETCHVAHIDALATPDPIVLAHRIADETAPTFNCSNEPIRVGGNGKSPM